MNTHLRASGFRLAAAQPRFASRFRNPVLTPALILSTLFLPLSAGAQGGDLTPPGAPAPTMKALDQIEPRIAVNSTTTPGDADSIYRITEPGSYYLTGNIAGVSGKISIEIAVSEVSLDLMGFEMAGVAGSLPGIQTTVADVGNIAIRNGTIRNHNVGIDLSLSDDVLLSDLRVVANSGGGIKGRHAATIRNCTVSSNSGTGIAVQKIAVITKCTVQSNSSIGISTAASAVITKCSVRANIDGVKTLSGCIVSDTSSSGNSGRGFVVTDACKISKCVASSNNGDGFVAGKGCMLRHCTADTNTGAGDGIELVGEGSAVLDCTSYSNAACGILASNLNATVSGCTVYKNSSFGISIGAGVVTRCASFSNNFDGIRVAAVCRVTENTSTGNGTGAVPSAGIHVTQSDCTIENNIVNSNDIGIDVDSSPSVIIHNTARGNSTNYDIVAGNVTGTIVTTAGSMNAAANTYGNLSY